MRTFAPRVSEVAKERWNEFAAECRVSLRAPHHI